MAKKTKQEEECPLLKMAGIALDESFADVPEGFDGVVICQEYCPNPDKCILDTTGEEYIAARKRMKAVAMRVMKVGLIALKELKELSENIAY